MSLVLIIDDDHQLCTSFSKLLLQEGYSTATAFSGTEGIEQAHIVNPDLIVLDIRLPDMSGIEVFEVLHAHYPKLPVIIITAFGNTETAIGAIQKGAYDFIYKPFDVPEMLQLVEKAIITGRCMSSLVEVNPGPENYSGREALVGSSRQMLEVYKAIGRVSSTNATVLIRGESGTGKELASRAIYNYSDRVDLPFMVVNCVAIPETLLESELFGYEKGTFTGATHRRLGKIEQARGGTVFLDEVGDMPLSIQAKLLRLLQENSIERLGGKEPIDVDVRIIAATNRDLEKAVREGKFREDLYYRLRVVSITMPPLRERKDDINILVTYLLARLTKEMAITSPGITSEAIAKLSRYDWPGNIRELSNTLKKTLIFNRGAPILAEDISFPSIIRPHDATGPAIAKTIQAWIRHVLKSGEHERSYDFCLDHIASVIIQEGLSMTKGNRSQAAKILGISRPTLHAKMEKYGIDQAVEQDD
ncbi:sigma-54-dependent transcriptional regulator [Desulfosediminicola flagellatus]|uniref:sigma-54-dependent transcriptional regulator n=1 Tax=Desulfosediminicola flagellatus TaxID=2569541 RepID=UPI0010AC406C|nr:sigma-54 dependent transcriptional regulator [Desulfosediminicola flagellatus]